MFPFRIKSFVSLLLLIYLGSTSQAQVPGPGDHVAGKVVDARSGRPVAHAHVSLDEVRTDRSVGTVSSADDGSFQFPDPVPRGKYRLQASAPGYLSTAYLQHGQLSTAIVTGAGLATGALRLALTPAATLTGHVVDERGDPVPHATVSLFRQGLETGSGTTDFVNTLPVDDDGSYEFYPLLPGRYYLAARAQPWYAVHTPPEPPGVQQLYGASIDPALDVVYPTVFYPAALSAEAALPFEVSEGEQMTADIQMVPQHALTLTLRRHGTNSPPSQLVERIFGSDQPLPVETSMSEDGETLVGVPPGRYTLREYTGGGNRIPFTAGTVDMTNGSVVREAPAVPQFLSLTVNLRSGTSDPLPQQTVVTLVSPEGESTVSSAVNDKGAAEFQLVPPGSYRLRLASERRPNLPVSLLTVNGRPAPDLQVQVAGTDHLAVTAVVSGPPVTVEGTALRDGKPAPESLILLVPAGANTDPELFRSDQSDLDGTFSLPAVTPGKYLLIALDDAWSLARTDLRALKPYLLHAQPVFIPAGRSATLHLPQPITTQPRH